MSDIEEVKQRTDVVEVIGGYLTLSKSGRNFRALCPFHKEKTPSFFVFPDRQSWHCFGACNTGGDVFSFVMKKEGIGFGDALRKLAGRAGVALRERSEGRPEEKEKLAKLYQINEAAARYFHEALGLPAAAPARQYLDKRGVSQKSAKDFMLGYSPGGREALKRSLVDLGYIESDLLEAGVLVQEDGGGTHDRFRSRLIFPIFDFQGRVIGFGGRVLDDSLPKYLNSPQTPVFDKSRSLYAVNLAREAARQVDGVVLVEGYLDVITAHQHGFANVIAAMGTSITEGQVDIIKKLSHNLILALDPDAAGEEAVLRCVGYENRLGAEVRVSILPAGEDPDEVIRRDPRVFEARIKGAVPVMDYAFDMMTAGLDLSTARGKTGAVARLLPLVAEVKDDIRREHYLNKLARLVETSYNVIEASFGQVKPRPGLRRIQASTADRDLKKALSSPLEEYCLTLLLKHPDLMVGFSGLEREYFEDTRQREIFDTFQRTKNLAELREQLDEALHDYLDYLANASVKTGAVEGKFKQCALRLRGKYLRRVAARRGQALAQETVGDMTPESLVEIQQPSREISEKLREVERQLGGRRGRGKEVPDGRGR